MWTLVLITVVMQSSNGGGTATNTSFLDFTGQTKCEAAARAIGVPSSAPIPSGSTIVIIASPPRACSVKVNHQRDER
jgi:hypothetical protein